MSTATKTTDHDAIRKWVEKREGRPSVVEDTVKNGRSGGILRIDFGEKDDALKEIEWDEFFKIFDENKLAFLHQEEGDSRFNKFVSAGDE
jgi:hypothetical protein